MSGLLALQGGLEHRAAFRELDERLVAHVRGRRPVVTVLPLASSARKRRPTAMLARRWWAERGAVAGIAPHGTPRDLGVAIRMVRHSDLVVLPGGVPDRLHNRLQGSPLWFEVVDAWRRGASLSGASSGAMVLCGRRQSVLPPFRITRGLGLLPVAAAAPHHDEVVLGLYSRLRSRLDPELPVLGIDTSTGLVGRDGRFQVLGTGAVRLAHRGTVEVRGPGEHLDLRHLYRARQPVDRPSTDRAEPDLVGLGHPVGGGRPGGGRRGGVDHPRVRPPKPHDTTARHSMSGRGMSGRR